MPNLRHAKGAFSAVTLKLAVVLQQPVFLCQVIRVNANNELKDILPGDFRAKKMEAWIGVGPI